MRKTFLSFLFLTFLFSTISQAQDEEKEMERSLKIYSSFQYLPLGNLPIYSFNLPAFSYNSTALGFYRGNKTKNRFIEFSLSFSKRSDEGKVTQTTIDTSSINNPPLIVLRNSYHGKSNELNVGLRFERGRWLERISTEKFKIGIGSSVRAFMHISDLKSTDPGYYPREREQYYLVFGVVPRIRYEVNSKFYFTLQFPFELFGFGVDFWTIKNPALTETQQKNGGADFNIGGETLIRLGAGYKF